MQTPVEMTRNLPVYSVVSTSCPVAVITGGGGGVSSLRIIFHMKTSFIRTGGVTEQLPSKDNFY